jgi:hypothetical protein
MIVSDAPNCGVTYDHNSFIIQATGWITLVRVSHFEVCSQNLGEIEKLADKFCTVVGNEEKRNVL